MHWNVNTIDKQSPTFILVINQLDAQNFVLQLKKYTPTNKNPSVWNFLSPELEVTWRTVAIIIRVVLLAPIKYPRHEASQLPAFSEGW